MQTGNSESGTAMLQVMFVALAGAVVAIAVSKMTSDSSSMMDFVSGKTGREAIVQTVLLNTNCAASFPSTPGCSDGSYVNLISKAGSATLIRADGTTVLGGFNVRARCVYQPSAGNFGLDIRIARLASQAAAGDPRLDFGHQTQASFRTESVSKLPLGWTHPKSALFSSPTLAPCAAAIGGVAANTTCPTNQVQLGIKPNGLPLCGPVPTPPSAPGNTSCIVADGPWYRGNAVYTAAPWPCQLAPKLTGPCPTMPKCPSGYQSVRSVIIDQRQQAFSSNNPKSGHTSWTETLYQRGLLCCR